MEESNKVRLHGTQASPFVRRVIWALKLKGIEYDYIEEDLSNKSAALLQCNPVHKKVPVLVHGGKPVAESAIILEYIEETWPDRTPLLPKDPYERAMARFWIDYGHQKSRVFHEFLTSSEEGKKKAAKSVLETFKTIQDEALGDKKFFGGDKISLVDLCFGWLTSFGRVERVVGVQVLEPTTLPRLHRWTQDFKQVPGIKENLPDTEKQLPELENLKKHLVTSKELIRVLIATYESAKQLRVITYMLIVFLIALCICIFFSLYNYVSFYLRINLLCVWIRSSFDELR